MGCLCRVSYRGVLFNAIMCENVINYNRFSQAIYKSGVMYTGTIKVSPSFRRSLV